MSLREGSQILAAVLHPILLELTHWSIVSSKVNPTSWLSLFVFFLPPGPASLLLPFVSCVGIIVSMLATLYEAVWSTSRQTLLRTNATDVPWLWKVVAACFSAVQLIGWVRYHEIWAWLQNRRSLTIVAVSRYMMLAVVVGSPPHELRINATVSTVTAFVFVGTSYGVSALIAFAQRHQTMFLLHSIFM